MITVWKFEFEVADTVFVDMPDGAKVLAVGSQNPGHVCLWAKVVPGAPVRKRLFCVRGTGHPLGKAEGLPYLGTAFDGGLVWHVFGKNE